MSAIACAIASEKPFLIRLANRREENALRPDWLNLTQQVVHERRHRQCTKVRTCAGQKIIHCERRGDVPCVLRKFRSTTGRGNADNALNAVLANGFARRSGEIEISLLDTL
ncbi:MAG TPA: hypothetical protein VIL32_08580 [Steroidobacteraceae bacterium]